MIKNLKYIIDKTGTKTDVLISIEDWEKILADLEELHDIELYDKAKASNENSLPIDVAFEEIEKYRSEKQ